MTGASTEVRLAIQTFAEHEHDELAAGVDRIHELADELADLPIDQRAGRLAKVCRWIETDLQPHMSWEESWLFPQIDTRAGTPWATRLVRFDHQQIHAQAERLHTHGAYARQFPLHDSVTLALDLAGLEALVRAHVEREERFLLPLLEREADRWEPEWHD